MCGRYYVDDETAQEIEKLVRQVDEKLHVKRGDIHPTEMAMVMKADRDALAADNMNWGFPGFGGKGVIFNAKCETVKEKKMFADSVCSRRCIIPAKGFYEWNRQKEKVTFKALDDQILYMAGVWKHHEESSRFVILTTGANESVISVHERMPLILDQNEVADWILDSKSVDYMIHKVPRQLMPVREYEQGTLSF
ncbi:MAG TPA: SOS response-associated peptidase family protein [Lachnospiraceae bacterium]|nr:SOS response-associated peptidase family protein [Lachnospiraceae bacterium]